MTAFADYLDLQTAVVEQVGNADIVDVMPRLVKMAEVEFNRRLRCREQMTNANVTTSSGSVSLPTDYIEAISLTNAAGAEYVQQPVQYYDKLSNKVGFFAIEGSNLLAQDADYTLTYYAKVPTITDSMTDTNWLLSKHPGLYLYAVSLEVEKYLRNIDGAQAMAALRDMEFDAVARLDGAERFSRARVRVAGVTP